jgi:hypothetical protein
VEYISDRLELPVTYTADLALTRGDDEITR